MGKREKKQIKGTQQRPRLAVFRSNKHIYAQVIDDASSHTLAACSTLDAEIKAQFTLTANMQASQLVGETIGRKLKEKNIFKVVFDRSDKAYHGRVKALAEGARSAGISF